MIISEMNVISGEEAHEHEMLDQTSSDVGMHYNDWIRELMSITNLKASQMVDITPYDAYFGGMSPADYARYTGETY